MWSFRDKKWQRCQRVCFQRKRYISNGSDWPWLNFISTHSELTSGGLFSFFVQFYLLQKKKFSEVNKSKQNITTSSICTNNHFFISSLLFYFFAACHNFSLWTHFCLFPLIGEAAHVQMMKYPSPQITSLLLLIPHFGPNEVICPFTTAKMPANVF